MLHEGGRSEGSHSGKSSPREKKRNQKSEDRTLCCRLCRSGLRRRLGLLFLAGNRRELGSRRRPGDFTVLDDGCTPDDLILHIHIDCSILLGAQISQHMTEIRSVELAGLGGQAAWEIGVAYQANSMLYHDFTCFREFTVTALLRGEINDDATLFHQLNHIGEDQLWRRLPGNQRSSNDDVDLLSLLTEQSHLCLDERLAHDFGVASLTSPILLIFKIKHKKVRIHAFNLLFHLRARIKSANNGPHAAGGSNGC